MMPGEQEFKTLGDLVRADRRRQGWTQQQLASALNNQPPSVRPLLASGRRQKATQSLIHDLERNRRRKPLSRAVRKWLARTLGDDESAYCFLPVQALATDVPGTEGLPTDLSKAVRQIAREVLGKAPADVRVSFDTPERGPLSAANADLLGVLYMLIEQKPKSSLLIYANDTPIQERPLAEAFLLVLLLLLTKIRLKIHLHNGNVDENDEAEREEAIFAASRDAIRLLEQGSSEELKVSRQEYNDVLGPVTLFEPAGDLGDIQRLWGLPLTLVLMAGSSGPYRRAFLFDDAGRILRLRCDAEAAVHFHKRRQIVKPFTFDEVETKKRAMARGLKLEICPNAQTRLSSLP